MEKTAEFKVQYIERREVEEIVAVQVGNPKSKI
jgi:hypothetical protein